MNRRFTFLILLSLGLIVASGIYIVGDRTQVHYLKIAAGSKQSESYVFSQAMAQVVAKYQPHIQIQVIETKGSEENIKLLEQQKVQLATAQADTPTLPSARIVSFLFPDTFQLVVTEKSGIEDVSDLRGKRIALPPEGSGQYKSFWFLAEHYRLKPTDLRYLAITEQQADRAFGNNQVEAVFRVRPPGNQSILELVQNKQGRLVAIDQAAAMKIKQPALETAFIPKGAYQGNPPIPSTALPTVAVQRLFLANKDVDAEIVREITSILYERRQDLAAIISVASYISPPTSLSGTNLPIHPGAQAYYDREKPSFLQSNADYLGLILTLVLLIGSWIWNLKLRIERRQKNTGDKYNQKLVQLIEEIYQSDINRVEEIRQELFMMLKEVVHELDEDRIAPESFQSFTFTWEAALAAVRDREILISRQATHK